MALVLTDKEMVVVESAIKSAIHLLEDEYQSLCDEYLQEEYDRVLADLDVAAKLINKKEPRSKND